GPVGVPRAGAGDEERVAAVPPEPPVHPVVRRPVEVASDEDGERLGLDRGPELLDVGGAGAEGVAVAAEVGEPRRRLEEADPVLPRLLVAEGAEVDVGEDALAAPPPEARAGGRRRRVARGGAPAAAHPPP